MSVDLHVTDPTRLTGRELSAAVAVLAASYVDEPNFVDLFPDRDRRTRALPHVFAALCRDAARHGRVEVARHGDEPVGVAAWLAPGAFPPGPTRQARLTPDLLRTIRASPASVSRLARFNAAIAALHPAQPYAYLAAIGIRPDRQGEGIGHRLLAGGLAWADQQRVACHLEAQRPDTVAWYARHGFEVRSRTTVLSGGAVNWSMSRPARASTRT